MTGGERAAGRAKLEAFQYADDLAVELFAVTRQLPPDSDAIYESPEEYVADAES